MNGKLIKNQAIIVELAKQESLFTNSTGYISNWELNAVIDNPNKSFDSSMPEDHYTKQYEASLRQTDKVFTLKVNNLTNDTT